MAGETIEVELSSSEIIIAAHIGVLTTVYNRKRHCKDQHGAEPERGWDYSINGAIGEMAVAKAFGMFWDGHIGDRESPDVGPFEVRWTAPKDKQYLWVHKGKARPERPYILTTGYGPIITLLGWAYGYEITKYPCENKFNKKPPRPAHWMPLGGDMRERAFTTLMVAITMLMCIPAGFWIGKHIIVSEQASLADSLRTQLSEARMEIGVLRNYIAINCPFDTVRRVIIPSEHFWPTDSTIDTARIKQEPMRIPIGLDSVDYDTLYLIRANGDTEWVAP